MAYKITPRRASLAFGAKTPLNTFWLSVSTLAKYGTDALINFTYRSRRTPTLSWTGGLGKELTFGRLTEGVSAVWSFAWHGHCGSNATPESSTEIKNKEQIDALDLASTILGELRDWKIALQGMEGVQRFVRY